MICKFCGNEIDDGSEYCFICGQKVESEAAEQPAEVYSQTPEAAPAAPAEEAPAATEAPAEQAAAPAAPVPVAPVAPETPAAEEGGKKKKGKKVKDPNAAGKGVRFVAFLFAIIGLILYSKAKKQGKIEKANGILNALMRGLCIKMAIAIVVLGYKYFFAK